MSNTHSTPRAAKVRVPKWLNDKRASGFWASAKLHTRKFDDEPGVWLIEPEEAWLRRPTALVKVDHLAGPNRRARFETLKALGSADYPVLNEDKEWVILELNRASQRAIKTGSPVDGLSLAQLRTTLAVPSQLYEVVKECYENLLSIGMENNPDDKVFANAGVHLVRRTPELLYRIKMPSIWLQLTDDPKLAIEDPHRIFVARSSGQSIFASSEGLYDGILTLDAYLGPLTGALSPYIWAFPATGMLGSIIYSLGQPLAGARGSAAELIQMLHTRGSDKSVAAPTLDPDASADAIDWWAGQINAMFGVLSDPAVFTNTEGFYIPAKHLHALLSVEQLVRRVFSTQTSHRDTNARRILLFTVLDTLERLTGRDLSILCSLRFAEKTLSELTVQIPSPASQVLLPGAERAVEALRELQDGFFISRRKQSSQIEWTESDGSVAAIDADLAAAHYIKVLRDATHGHGTKHAKNVAKTNALLTHHNGHIPHDLGLLGYLYLLDILHRPDDLRATLYAHGRV